MFSAHVCSSDGSAHWSEKILADTNPTSADLDLWFLADHLFREACQERN